MTNEKSNNLSFLVELSCCFFNNLQTVCLCPDSGPLNHLCVWIMFQNAISHSCFRFLCSEPLIFSCYDACFGSCDCSGKPHTQGEISAHSRFALWQLYLEQLRSARPLLHIHLQALVQEVLEHRWQLVLLLDLRLPVCGNQIQRLQGTHRKTVWLRYCRQPKLLSGFMLCPGGHKV